MSLIFSKQSFAVSSLLIWCTTLINFNLKNVENGGFDWCWKANKSTWFARVAIIFRYIFPSTRQTSPISVRISRRCKSTRAANTHKNAWFTGFTIAARRFGADRRPRRPRWTATSRTEVVVHLGRPREPMTSERARSSPPRARGGTRSDVIARSASSQVQERRNVESRAGIRRGNLSGLSTGCN